MTRVFDRTVLLGIAAVFVITAGNSVLAFQNTRVLYETAGQVTHTHAVLEALAELLSTAKDAETGQRGFVITGDPQYLQPYHFAEGSIASWIRRIDTLTHDNPQLQAELPELRRVMANKLDELRETLALRQNEGFAAAERMMIAGRGMAMMDSLRGQVRRMVADAERQLQERTAIAARSRNSAISALIVAGLLQLVTLVAMIYLLRRKIRHRERVATIVREQKEWFRTTLSSIGDAVITTDTGGRVTFLNVVAEQLTGWGTGEAEGRSLEEVFHILNEDSRSPVSNPALRALREGVVVDLANHTLLIARDGAERPIDDSAAPIRDGQGSVVGAVLVFRDVTARREAERRLHEADQRKDEFLAVLAHELRNPLAPLRHALEILRLAPDDRAAVEQVGGIMERQLRQMVRLIDDLLDVSRITSNRLELRREPVDIAAVVHGAVETCSPLLGQSGHSLELTLPTHPLYVDVDRARMTQAVANLLSNAIKYTETGGRIWLTVERAESDAVITVRDTGIGIPENMVERVFEMFTQVDSSLERTHGGLGIGLHLVQQIIEMHGGSVAAHSAGRGRGSEFIVRLPVVVAPAVQARPSTASRPNSRPRRILVADDNADSAGALAMMLRMMGHEVCVAHNGVEALAEGDRFHPDVALLDIGMPKLNGYDTARRVRALEWGRHIVLVALTGWGQEEDRRRSEQAGFDHHMVKPAELSVLEELLDQIEPSVAGK